MAKQALTRLENWPIILDAFCKKKDGETFAWGKNDCILFCADAVSELTGVDLAQDIRGTYATQDEAALIISQFGSSVEDIITHYLGEPKPVHYAQRGDIVTFNSANGVTAGIVDASGKYALMWSENGLARLPLLNCLNAWEY